MKARLLLLATLFLAPAACAPRFINGTQIPDNPNTRAILSLMDRYRAALEARDAQAVMKLVSPNFRDNAGTETLEDDLTYEELPKVLPGLFNRLQDTRVDLDVRRVEVQGTQASAVYYWNAIWRMPALTGKPQRESELEQMTFEKVDGEWRILSGI